MSWAAGADPGALFAGDAAVRRTAGAAARGAAVVYAQRRGSGNPGRLPDSAALRCGGRVLLRVVERTAPGHPPERLSGIFLRCDGGCPARTQRDPGLRTGQLRPGNGLPREAEAAARRDVLPGAERDLADRMAGDRTGTLYNRHENYAGPSAESGGNPRGHE